MEQVKQKLAPISISIIKHQFYQKLFEVQYTYIFCNYCVHFIQLFKYCFSFYDSEQRQLSHYLSYKFNKFINFAMKPDSTASLADDLRESCPYQYSSLWTIRYQFWVVVDDFKYYLDRNSQLLSDMFTLFVGEILKTQLFKPVCNFMKWNTRGDTVESKCILKFITLAFFIT